MTALQDALERAGFDTAEAKLRMLAIDALTKHHGNIERAIPTFIKSVGDDKAVIEESLKTYLRQRASELPVGGHGTVVNQRVNAVDRQSSTHNGADHTTAVDHRKVVRPVRGPSSKQLAAAAAVAKSVALTILDTYRIRDGRAIGDVRFGELEHLRSANAMEASLIRQIQRHATASHDARVRDVVKAKDLQRMIQRAAEVADAA